MTTFGEYNGRVPDVQASSEQIRHYLWRLDNADPDALEPPSGEPVGPDGLEGRTIRAALDNAVADDNYRLSTYDESHPYRNLHVSYADKLDELRTYITHD